MHSEQALVSVIVPSYNRVQYIEQNIKSILSQSYSNIEIVVVDDGSTDGTYEKLQAFEAENKIILLTHENHQNYGQSASINIGIKRARGEFIAILDSDDYYVHEGIERLVDGISGESHVGMVYGCGEVVNSEGVSMGYRTLKDNHVEMGDPNRILLNFDIAIPGGSLVRSNIYEKVGFFEESFRAAQDHDMALRIFENTTVKYINNTVFNYRKHDDSISKKALEKRWRVGFEILGRARKRYPYSPKAIRKRRAVLNFRLGHTLLTEKKPFRAIPFLVLSGLLDPLRAVNVMLGKENVR